MIPVLFVLAAAAGTTIRWWASRANRAGRPLGTLAVNVVAAFLLGLLVGSSAGTAAVIGVGHLGSLSTFSTVMKEIHSDLEAGRHRAAVVYVTVTIVAGVAAAAAGIELAS